MGSNILVNSLNLPIYFPNWKCHPAVYITNLPVFKGPQHPPAEKRGTAKCGRPGAGHRRSTQRVEVHCPSRQTSGFSRGTGEIYGNCREKRQHTNFWKIFFFSFPIWIFFVLFFPDFSDSWRLRIWSQLVDHSERQLHLKALLQNPPSISPHFHRCSGVFGVFAMDLYHWIIRFQNRHSFRHQTAGGPSRTDPKDDLPSRTAGAVGWTTGAGGEVLTTESHPDFFFLEISRCVLQCVYILFEHGTFRDVLMCTT